MSRALCALAAVAILASGCASRRAVAQLEAEVGRLRAELAEMRIAQEVTARDLARVAPQIQALDAYYARLLGVTERAEWEEWIAYFLAGVATQADDALGRIRRIDALLTGWRGRLSREPSRLPDKGIELFAQNPFWTVKRLAESLGVAFTTAQRMIDRLESAGIVARVGEAKRNRVYCARAILEILEEPPRLGTDRTAR